MEIPKEKIQELKKQVIDQINSTFSEEKKQPAIQQVNSMNDSDFIEFLKQNNLIQEGSSGNPENSQDSPFRQIVQGKIPSSKVGENEKALAVLEINPVSPGHAIIIPKQACSEPQKLPEMALDLSKEMQEKIKSVLNPKKVLIELSNVLGEVIINVIPQYSDEDINSERTSAKPEELEEIQNKIISAKEDSKKQEKTQESEKPAKQEKIIIPKRIP